MTVPTFSLDKIELSCSNLNENTARCISHYLCSLYAHRKRFFQYVGVNTTQIDYSSHLLQHVDFRSYTATHENTST